MNMECVGLAIRPIDALVGLGLCTHPYHLDMSRIAEPSLLLPYIEHSLAEWETLWPYPKG